MAESDMVPLWNLRPSRFQPRAPQFDADGLLELAQSIKDNGLINPILVFSYDDEEGYVAWELIAGERRSRACVALKLAELFTQHSLADWAARLANVGLGGMGDEEREALRKANAHIAATVHEGRDLQRIHVLAVVENQDRESLSFLEEARAYQSLMTAYGWSQREAAGHVNKSQGYVAQRLSMLALPPVAQDAMNTRVISFSHARAIAGVPKAAQDAATAWTIRETGKDAGKSASTRDVEDRMHDLATFLDPDRWQPNGIKTYTPEERNRLRAIRSLVTHIDPRDASNVLELGEVMLYGAWTNLLKKSPIGIIKNEEYFSMVMNALGMHTPSTKIIPQYTAMLQLTCDRCIFNKTDVPVKMGNYSLNYLTHCPRWYNSSVRRCEHCITPDDPVVIPVNNAFLQGQLGARLQHADLLAYVDDREVYIAAIAETLAAQSEKISQDSAAAATKFLDRMRAWYDWQQSINPALLGHSQAHTCEKCAHYAPMFAQQSLPPCQFALSTLTGFDNRPRAPEYVVWINEHNATLPRCEMFAYREPLKFGPYSDHYKFPDHTFMFNLTQRLFKKAFESKWYWNDVGLWGPLHWLYGEARTFDNLWHYLVKNWDRLGDDTIIHLVQVGLNECDVIVAGLHGQKFGVYEPVTGIVEKWTAQEFDALNATE
jgi:ParB-like chromosome segregation protein Spo0J